MTDAEFDEAEPSPDDRSYDLWSPDDVRFGVTNDEFLSRAADRWPGRVSAIRYDDVAPYDVGVVVDDLAQVDYARDHRSVQIFYASAEAAAEVATWFRGLQPNDLDGRVWLIRTDLRRHVELPAGVTVGQVATGWIEHESPSTDIWLAESHGSNEGET